MGCEGRGFFSLFGGPAAAMQCRSTIRSSRCAPISIACSPICSGCKAIPPTAKASAAPFSSRSDRTIAARNIANLLIAAAEVQADSSTVCSADPDRSSQPGLHPDAQCSGDHGRQYLPDALRAHLRRLLFPDLLLDRAKQVCRGREGLPGHVPGRRGGALQPSQSRRGHFTSGVERRPQLFRTAQCLRLPQGVQSVLQLQGIGPDLGRGAQASRRPARSSAATSSSTKNAHGNSRSRKSTRKASRSGRHVRRQGQNRRPPAAPRVQHLLASTTVTEEKTEDGEPAKRQVRTVGPTFLPVALKRGSARNRKRRSLSPWLSLSSERSGFGSGAPESRKRLTIG